MKKQTAVDWLSETIYKNHDRSFLDFYRAEITQAKEMEKQQIEEAWENGYDHGACVNTDKDKYHGTQYYKENYEKH